MNNDFCIFPWNSYTFFLFLASVSGMWFNRVVIGDPLFVFSSQREIVQLFTIKYHNIKHIRIRQRKAKV